MKTNKGFIYAIICFISAIVWRIIFDAEFTAIIFFGSAVFMAGIGLLIEELRNLKNQPNQ